MRARYETSSEVYANHVSLDASVRLARCHAETCADALSFFSDLVDAEFFCVHSTSPFVESPISIDHTDELEAMPLVCLFDGKIATGN